ncbi:MAG: MerR family transcriptional regulator [Saprospiraceae bacterium]|nr:MerR family transcriptional regulator [Saprospiraceae bacterium]
MIDLNALDKLYYSIGEVADMMGVSKSLIRYWENEFDFLNPRKNKKGDRRFTKENIQQLLIIHELVKERGFTLEGAKQEIRSTRKKLLAKQQVIEKLQHIREGLQRLSSDYEGGA